MPQAGHAPKTNLRSHVAYTSYTEGNDPDNYNAASFYSYDNHACPATGGGKHS
jgi:hypothetical protein